MRKITSKIRKAFWAGKPLKIDNTRTDGTAVYLHGTKIIEKRPDGVYATLGGWNTNTTRERLNGILDGVHVRQKNFAAILNDTPISSSEWVRVG